MTRLAVTAAVAAACAAFVSPRLAEAQRALGVDVSHWQGSINWASVQSAGYSFAFIKGTEDDYYVDDYFASNVTKLSNTSMLFGAYHFAKPTGTTTTSTAAIVADAIGEADFFVNNARSAMLPGHIIPTLDLESGNGLTNAQLTSWVLAFSDQVNARLGVKPMVYLNSAYSAQVNSGVSSLPLWWARVPTATTGYSTNTALTSNPTTDYGAWGTNTSVWKFWQYSWVGSVPGINGNVDLDVAHGDIEYVKDLAIPAMWTDATGGNFGSSGKWNNLDGAAGTLYFPNANARAIISMANAAPVITYSGSNRIARSLQCDETINFNSGTLSTVQYANFTGATTFNGGGLNAGTTLSNTGTMIVNSGTATATGAFTGTGTTAVNGGTLAAASLSQASLTVGGGTANVTGALVTTAGTSISGGTLNVGSIPSGTLALTGTGFAKFTGTGGSKVTSLAVANTAGLDIGLTELAVDYTTSSPLASIRSAIQAGAIFSNKAVAGVTGVGAVESKTKFGNAMTTAQFGDGTSVTVDATTVLLALALFGDANLDGTVNVSDLGTLASFYGMAGTWATGDANYDGVIDVSDLGALATNYGRTLNADGTYTSANPAQFQIDLASFASIPEPASLAAIGLAGLAMRRRRRA